MNKQGQDITIDLLERNREFNRALKPIRKQKKGKGIKIGFYLEEIQETLNKALELLKLNKKGQG